MKNIFILSLIACGMLCLPRISAAADSLGADGTAGAECSGCSLILISLDAVQAAHLHAFGYPGNPAPRLDSLFEHGCVFSNAVSAAPWTVPATMSILTGTYPSVHKVTNKFSVYTKDQRTPANLKRLSPSISTLAELLKREGYATAGFTGDAGVNSIYGYGQGFDVYSDSVPPFSGFDTSAPPALAWLKKNGGGRFFLFLHGYDAHGQAFPRGGLTGNYVPRDYKGPFTGTPQEQGRLREEGLKNGRVEVSTGDVVFWRAVYDEKISRLDSEVADFLARAKEAGALDRTLVVVTADHGTELFEHGRIDHGFSLYDELLHVPLAFILPGAGSGARIKAQVSTVDILPTILDILGIKAAPALAAQLQGESLAPLLRGASGPGHDAFAETDYRLYTHKRGIRTADGWKYIYTEETKKSELYDLNSDPAETRDLAGSEKRRAYELEKKVFDFFRLSGRDPAAQLGCDPVYMDQCN
jgi:arylsulfatase A-like enzyme